MTYDSTDDTRKHIGQVRDALTTFIIKLSARSLLHDASKLSDPEKPLFDKMTPKLAKLTYGSDEYKDALRELGTALEHHYAHNSHHPEHYENGIDGMDLLDVVEMLCDWKAATERHDNGDLAKSLEINRRRFGIGDQLYAILLNTAKRVGWLGEQG